MGRAYPCRPAKLPTKKNWQGKKKAERRRERRREKEKREPPAATPLALASPLGKKKAEREKREPPSFFFGRSPLAR